MLLDIMKKIAVIVTIAILFTVLTFSIVDLVNERPEYDDYCGRRYYEKTYLDMKVENVNINCSEFTDASAEEQETCYESGGEITYEKDENGCPLSYECNMCRKEFDDANSRHRLIGFIVSSLLGLIAIIVGLYATSKSEVIQWVLAGFIIGGIASIFFGTISYYQDMSKVVRPITMIAEICLIVWVALRTYNKQNKLAKKKK